MARPTPRAWLLITLGVSACDCGSTDGELLEPPDASPSDADQGDGAVADAGAIDSGSATDGGICSGPPTLRVDPSDHLELAPSHSSGSVHIFNDGCETLMISGIALNGVVTSLDDFSIEGCGPGPCPPSSVCGALTLCPRPFVEAVVHYDNNDISGVDLVELRIDSNDGDVTVALSGSDQPCFFPTPFISLKYRRASQRRPRAARRNVAFTK